MGGAGRGAEANRNGTPTRRRACYSDTVAPMAIHPKREMAAAWYMGDAYVH
jgi:hypothetical protein